MGEEGQQRPKGVGAVQKPSDELFGTFVPVDSTMHESDDDELETTGQNLFNEVDEEMQPFDQNAGRKSEGAKERAVPAGAEAALADGKAASANKTGQDASDQTVVPDAGDPTALDKKVKLYDALFPASFEKLNALVKSADHDYSSKSELLYSSQLQSVQAADRLGALDAGSQRKDAVVVQRLEENAFLSEREEERRFDALSNKSRDLKISRGCFLVASGVDANVAEGEKQLARLVKDNPALTVDQSFRETLNRALSEMVAIRIARGLPPWNSALRTEDLFDSASTGQTVTAGDTNAGNAGDVGATSTTDDLFQEASDTFFKTGIGGALPLFERAKRQADVDLDRVQKERVGLFIQTLKHDTKTALVAYNGGEIDELSAQRLDLEENSTDSYIRCRDALSRKSAVTIDCAFAKIASGKQELFVPAQDEIIACLHDNPEIGLSAEFKECRRGAFKAHYENKSGDADGGVGLATKEKPDQAVESKIGYKDLQLPHNFDSEDKEVKPYAVDTITSIGLFAFGVGLGLRAAMKMRNRYRAIAEQRAAAKEGSTAEGAEGTEGTTKEQSGSFKSEDTGASKKGADEPASNQKATSETTDLAAAETAAESTPDAGESRVEKSLEGDVSKSDTRFDQRFNEAMKPVRDAVDEAIFRLNRGRVGKQFYGANSPEVQNSAEVKAALKEAEPKIRQSILDFVQRSLTKQAGSFTVEAGSLDGIAKILGSNRFFSIEVQHALKALDQRVAETIKRQVKTELAAQVGVAEPRSREAIALSVVDQLRTGQLKVPRLVVEQAPLVGSRGLLAPEPGIVDGGNRQVRLGFCDDANASYEPSKDLITLDVFATTPSENLVHETGHRVRDLREQSVVEILKDSRQSRREIQRLVAEDCVREIGMGGRRCIGAEIRDRPRLYNPDASPTDRAVQADAVGAFRDMVKRYVGTSPYEYVDLTKAESVRNYYKPADVPDSLIRTLLSEQPASLELNAKLRADGYERFVREVQLEATNFVTVNSSRGVSAVTNHVAAPDVKAFVSEETARIRRSSEIETATPELREEAVNRHLTTRTRGTSEPRQQTEPTRRATLVPLDQLPEVRHMFEHTQNDAVGLMSERDYPFSPWEIQQRRRQQTGQLIVRDLDGSSDRMPTSANYAMKVNARSTEILNLWNSYLDAGPESEAAPRLKQQLKDVVVNPESGLLRFLPDTSSSCNAVEWLLERNIINESDLEIAREKIAEVTGSSVTSDFFTVEKPPSVSVAELLIRDYLEQVDKSQPFVSPPRKDSTDRVAVAGSRDVNDVAASGTAEGLSRHENGRQVAEAMLDQRFMESVLQEVNRPKLWGDEGYTESERLTQLSENLETRFRSALEAKLKSLGLRLPESIEKVQIEVITAKGHSTRALRPDSAGTSKADKTFFVVQDSKRPSRTDSINPVAVSGDDAITGTTGKTKVTPISRIAMVFSRQTIEGQAGLANVYEKYIELAQLEGRDPLRPIADLRIQQESDAGDLKLYKLDREDAQPSAERPVGRRWGRPERERSQAVAETKAEAAPTNRFVARLTTDAAGRSPENIPSHLGQGNKRNHWEGPIEDAVKAKRPGLGFAQAKQIAEYIDCLYKDEVVNHNRRGELHPTAQWVDKIDEAITQLDTLDRIIRNVPTRNGEALSYAQAKEINFLMQNFDLRSPVEASRIMRIMLELEKHPDFARPTRYSQHQAQLSYIIYHEGLDPSKPEMVERAEKLLVEANSEKLKPFSDYGETNRSFKQRYDMLHVRDTLGLDSLETCKEIVSIAERFVPTISDSRSLDCYGPARQSALRATMIMYLDPTLKIGKVEDIKRALHLYEHWDAVAATRGDSDLRSAYDGIKAAHEFAELSHGQAARLEFTPGPGETKRDMLTRYVAQRVASEADQGIRDRWSGLQKLLTTQSPASDAFVEGATTLAAEAQSLTMLSPEQLMELTPERYGQLLQRVSEDHLMLLDHRERAAVISNCLEPMLEKNKRATPIERATISGAVWGVVEPLVKADTTRGHLTFEQYLRTASNNSLAALMGSANADWLGELPTAEGIKIQQLLLAQAGERTSQLAEMPDLDRVRFFRSWARAMELGLADNPALRSEQCERLLGALRPGDVNMLGVDLVIKLIDKAPFNALEKMNPGDVHYLAGCLRRQLLEEAESAGKTNAVEAPLEPHVREYAEKMAGTKETKASVEKVLQRFTDPAERKQAAEILADRSKFLTPRGTDRQLRQLAEQLRSHENFGVVQAHNNIRTGFQNAERLTVLVSSESSPGHALAVMYRNETGMSVDIKIVKSSADLPTGPAVLFDPMAEGPLSEAIARRQQVAPTDGRIVVPQEVLNFDQGVNFFDLAKAPLGEDHMRAVEQEIRAEMAVRKSAPGTHDTAAQLEGQVDHVMAAIEQSSGNHQRLMEFRGLLNLHNMRNQEMAVRQAQAFAKATDFVSPEDIMRLSVRLKEKLASEIDCKKALFVVDLDKEGSSHLITTMFREANPEFKDHQFVTLKTVQKLAAAGRLNDGGVSALIYLDDCLDSGPDSMKRVNELLSVTDLSKGQRPEIIAAMLGRFEGEVDALNGAKHIAARDLASMETNIRTRLTARESGPVPELLAAIGESQWYASKMTPLVVTFYGVPNNCARGYVQFAKSLGSAQSNKLSVDTYAKPLRLMAEQLGLLAGTVSDSSVVAAMDRVLDAGNLSKRESHALRMIRESVADLQPGSKGIEHMKMLRAYLGLVAPGEQSVHSKSSSGQSEVGTAERGKPDTTRQSARNTAADTGRDTKPVQPGEGPLVGDLLGYDSLPTSPEMATLNQELNTLLTVGSREEVAKMTPAERERVFRDAVDKILPTMKQYAQTLGMSPDMVTSDSVRIDLVEGMGVYTFNSDRITLNPFSLNPVSTAMHELVHKMRWLDLLAAFKADPDGVRLALLDNCLDSIGKTRRINVDSQNVDRHMFKDPEAAREFREHVDRHIRVRLRNGPPISDVEVPAEKPYSPALLKEFAFSEMAIAGAIIDESRNFGFMVAIIADSSEKIGGGASEDYVKRKAAEYKAWIEGTRGEAVVRYAIRDVQRESAEGTLSKTELRESVRKRVALLTATESGNAATGISVSDRFIDTVAETAASAPSDPAAEARIAREYAAVFANNAVARGQFEASQRSLKDNPYLQKILITSSIDAVARGSGSSEYAFSSDEIAASKWEVAERARGVARELREPSLAEGRRTNLEQSFTELTDFLMLTTRQQQLHQAMLRDDISESRRLARELVGMMTHDVTAYAEHIDFLLESGLVQPSELPASLESFDRHGGRARAMAMSKVRLGEFWLADAVKDTYTIPGGRTEYLLREPILLGDGPTALTVRAIQVDKDGSLSVYSLDRSNTPQLDPIEHHWFGDFTKDAAAVAKDRAASPAALDKVALAIDYLQGLDRQMGTGMARDGRRIQATTQSTTIDVGKKTSYGPVVTPEAPVVSPGERAGARPETPGERSEGSGARPEAGASSETPGPRPEGAVVSPGALGERTGMVGGRPEASVARTASPGAAPEAAAARAAIHEGFLEQCRQSGIGDEGLAQLKRLKAETLDKVVSLDKAVQADYIEGFRRGILKAETVELMLFDELADRRPTAETMLHGMVTDSKLVYSSADFAEVVFGLAVDKDLHEITLQPTLAHGESKEITPERLERIADKKHKTALETWSRSENPKVRSFAQNILTLLEHNESVREFGVYLNKPNSLESRVTAANSDLEIMMEQLKLPIAGEDAGTSLERHTRTAADFATSERHSQIEGLQVRSRNLGDICVTVRFVAPDGVVTAKPMRLVDITSEILDGKLERLNANELNKKIELAKDKIKTAEAANDKALVRRESERLKGMQELAKLKAEYDAKVGEVGTGDRVAMKEAGVRFCEGKLHAMKAGPRSAFKEIMGKGGMITGVLLLFNAFAPEMESEPLEYERLRPGG